MIHPAAVPVGGGRDGRPPRRRQLHLDAFARRAGARETGIDPEVVPNEKIGFTDAFVTAWARWEKPIMAGVLTFENADEGKTKYPARIRPWTVSNREAHDKMGFGEGWSVATSQVEAGAPRL